MPLRPTRFEFYRQEFHNKNKGDIAFTCSVVIKPGMVQVISNEASFEDQHLWTASVSIEASSGYGITNPDAARAEAVRALRMMADELDQSSLSPAT